MKSILFLAAALLLLLGDSVSRPAAAQAVGANHVEIAPLGFQSRTLDNGLAVYSLRDPATADVTVQVWYRVGAKDDPAGRSGFAHLFEHMMFKATRNLPLGTIDRLTEDVGGFTNASTDDDFTEYYDVVPANHLERVLFAEAERMGGLVVNQAIFDSERDVVKEELRQRVLATPYGRLFAVYVPREVYREHPYRRAAIGSVADLDAATIEDVRRFHATYYRPDNAVLIVAGNFDQAQLDGWVDRYFGPIPRPDRPIPPNDVAEPAPAGPREVTYYAPNVPLPAVVAAWPLPAYGHPDRAALRVLDGILSTGASSRLYRSLVYAQQIAAAASTRPDMGAQAGYFTAYAVMAGGADADAGEAALLAEVGRLGAEPVSADELAEAKNELIAGILRGRETAQGRAFTLGHALMMTGDAALPDRAVAGIEAVTPAELMRVARRYLAPQRLTLIRYLDESARPADVPAEPTPAPTSAPVTLTDLARDYAVVALAPEGERAAIPPPGPERTVATPDVVERRLANGLRVLVAPTTGVPLISAHLAFDAGGAEDPPGRAGVASFTASLVTQGTSRLSAPEIATAIERLGAEIGARAGDDFTSVYASSPAHVFDRTFALLAEIVRDPVFAGEELERLRAQNLDGLRVSLGEPGRVAGQAASRLVYGDAAYGAPSDGTLDSLPRIERADVVDFHRTRWVPSQASLIFSGDIAPGCAFALAEAAFGDWRDPADAAPPNPDPAGPAVPPRVVAIDMPGAGQAAVLAVARAPGRGDPDYYPMVMGAAVMGGGYSARLNREIRLERGLSYGADAGLGTRQDDGYLVASAQTRNDAVPEVAEVMLAEIARLSTEDATADELATRRAAMVGDLARTLETVDGLGGTVSTLAAYRLPLSDLAESVPRIRAVTGDQIRAAAGRYLRPAQVSLVVAGDAARFIDELRAAFPQVEVIPVIALDLNGATLRAE
jgi:zinc protease